jgi:hypothetical protein
MTGATNPTVGGETVSDEAVNVALASLTDLERELLLGTAKGWGSWMFDVGADLCAKGLGRRDNRGSIYFDTPLACATITKATGADQ